MNTAATISGSRVMRRPRCHEGPPPDPRPGTRQRHPWRRSVTRDGAVDPQRPGLDAPHDVADVRESLGHEMLAGRLAADPMMTMEDERRVPREVLDVLHAGFVEMPRAFDLG